MADLPPTAPRGHSFIGLLFVLLTLTVLTAIAAPRMNLTRIRADSMARNVSSVVASAARVARQRRIAVVVRIDSVGRRIGVLQDRNANGVRDEGEVETWLPLDAGSAVADPPRSLAAAERPDRELTFTAGGRRSDGLLVYLTADGLDPQAWRAVRVLPATAAVELWRYDGTQWSRARA
jgi:hypothetical protein